MFTKKDTTGWKRLFAIAVLICVVATTFSVPMAAMAEEEQAPDVVGTSNEDIPDYAEFYIDESGQIKTVNVEKFDAQGMVVEENGIKAFQFGNSICLNISDKFIYDNPDGEEIYVDVKYWDGGRVDLYPHYDGYGTGIGVKKGFTGEPNTFTSGKLAVLGDDPMWREKRFIITDFAAMNRVAGGFDIRISNWTLNIGNNGFTYKPVVQSIKIYRKPWASPLRMTTWGSFAGSERAGNMLSDTETPVLNIPFFNASTDSAIKTKMTVNIRNANDMLISTHSSEFELAAGEAKTVPIEVANPVRHGVYYAEIVTETSTNGGEYVADDEWKQVDFSISHLWDATTLNERVGMNEHNLTPSDVDAEMMMRAGIGWIRQGQIRDWHRLVDGRYVNDKFEPMLKEFYDRGIDIQMELRQPFWTEASTLSGAKDEMSFGGWERMPRNDEELQYFAKFAADMTYQFREYIDDIEIFNEPELYQNVVDGTYGGAKWAEVVKEVYKQVKAVTPEISVSGPTTTDFYTYLLDPFIDNGGLDNVDVFTMHRYDWSGGWDVETYGHDVAQQHIDHFEEKGYDNVRIWLTEVGFTSQDMRKEGHLTGEPAFSEAVYPGGAPRRAQARNTAMANASFYGFNKYEKWFWHTFPDRADATENEECFGFINCPLGGQGYSPLSAKPNLIAVSGANNFLKTNTEEKGIIGSRDDQIWAFHYYTPEIQKDVMYIQAEVHKGAQRAYNLGCETVDVYDIFANYIGTMRSDDGIFTFSVYNDPYYVVGNFTKFEKADKKAEIEPVSIITSGINGDVVPFELKRNTNKNYTIEVDDLTVVSNEGFVGDTAKVMVQAPSWEYGRAYSTIKVFDEEGYLCYVSPGEIDIKDAATVTFERFKYSENSDTRWAILAKVTNNAQTTPLDGKLYIEKPTNIAEMNNVREFKDLAARTSITYLFKLPEMVNKQFIDMTARLELGTGFKAKLDEELDFTTAKYAYNKPTIDGANDAGEWTGGWFGANRQSNIWAQETHISTWTGVDDLSFTAQALWDEEYLYLLCITTDDVHVGKCKGATEGNYVNIWDMDGIQLGIHDQENINPVLKSHYAEVGFALEDTFGPVSWCWKMHYDSSKTGKPLTKTEFAVERYDTYTIYEMKMPWSELFYEGYVVNPANKMRMAILMNDDDGEGRIGMEYGGGIGSHNKDATLFSRMELVY